MTSVSAKVGMPPDQANALVDQQAFRREQDQLAHVWTFLGLAGDIANDGDWFRTSLATRSIFVQRFGTELKGFENLCVHRFHPLRTADKGKGPVVCGFHHWRYDKDGRALGIPMCEELFGRSPRELGAKLNAVEIATCGAFIFGRFPTEHADESLETFIGDSFPILAAMSRAPVAPHYLTRAVRANWKLCYQISLEDYHTVAVHPKTFGKIGYLKRDNIGYFRFGPHSAYFTNSDPDALTKMASACRAGAWTSANYRVFHIFPNLAVSHFQSDGQYWHIMVLQYVPEAPDRSTMRAWIYPAPFPANHAPRERWIAPLTKAFRPWVVRHYAGKVLQEDHDVCERLQTIANQGGGRPITGRLEERIVWFEEAYANCMSVKPNQRERNEA